jgi:hypothetical protein
MNLQSELEKLFRERIACVCLYVDMCQYVDKCYEFGDRKLCLFVHGDRRGYHVSYLGYLGELLKQHFGVIDSPDDENPFTIVIRITPAGTERYEVKGEYHYFTPFDHVLYAGHNDQTLWKWAGTHFERASIRGTDKVERHPVALKEELPASGLDANKRESPMAQDTSNEMSKRLRKKTARTARTASIILITNNYKPAVTRCNDCVSRI